MSAHRKILPLLLIVALAVSALSARKEKATAGNADERQRALQALSRLTFGARPGDVERVMSIGVDNWIEQQLHPEKISDAALDQRLAGLRTLKMSTQAMLEEFPPQPVIKAVIDGRMPMPSDPFRRAIYQAQIEQYRLRQENKAAQQEDQATPQVQRESRREARIQAQETAARIMALPPDKRMPEILNLGPQARRVLATGLDPADRLKLLDALTPEQRETLLALVNPALVVSSELQEGKLLRAIYSERQLEEVMTDFWFNHFNVFIGKGADRYLITSYERDVIRPHALGKFKDLLLASARSPAMLFYLDNWMSVGPNSDAATGVRRVERAPRRPFGRRRFPPRPRAQRQPGAQNAVRRGLNENYARELLELHTVGVDGGYTQHDVTEVARILTGWTIRQPRMAAEFGFNERMHEPGDKVVMGHRFKNHGEGEGKQLLEFLARQPATARFISRQLAQRFVSDDPPPALIARMADAYRKSDGDIREVLRTLFRSPEFWVPESYRAKVKTPLEFVTSALRAGGANTEDPLALAQALNRMGMPLYGAQQPNGYSTSASTWVNSAALLDRLNFALALAAGRLPGISFDVQQVLGSGAAPAEGERALAMLEQVLLGGGVSSQTHETIMKQLAQQQSSRPAPDGAASVNVNLIAGLLLGSPEFQRR